MKFPIDDKERDELLAEYKEELFRFARTVENPRLIIVVGQPGSGKSTVIGLSVGEFPDENVALINGDENRQNHPNFKQIMEQDEKKMAEHTDPLSRYLTKQAFDEARENNYNIVFEGTLRQREPISETLKEAKEQGYQTTLKVLAVNESTSVSRIFGRYERDRARDGFARYTEIQAHDAAYKQMPENLEHLVKEKLVDRVEVYNADGKQLHSFERDERGEWSQAPENIRSAVEQERERPLEPAEQETKFFYDKYTLSLMELRHADKQEIQYAKNLIAERDKHSRGHDQPAEHSLAEIDPSDFLLVEFTGDDEKYQQAELFSLSFDKLEHIASTALFHEEGSRKAVQQRLTELRRENITLANGNLNYRVSAAMSDPELEAALKFSHEQQLLPATPEDEKNLDNLIEARLPEPAPERSINDVQKVILLNNVNSRIEISKDCPADKLAETLKYCQEFGFLPESDQSFQVLDSWIVDKQRTMPSVNQERTNASSQPAVDGPSLEISPDRMTDRFDRSPEGQSSEADFGRDR